MKTVYIVVSNTGSVFTRMIGMYTRQPYNHVSISFDEELKVMYSFGRKLPWNPLIGGFVEEGVNKGTYARFPKTTAQVLSLNVSDESYGKLREEIDNFVLNKEKYKYNLLGVLGVIIGKEVKRSNAYFCSEFVTNTLYNSDVKLWDTPAYMVKPYDYSTNKRLKLLYEGKLSDYEKEE